MILGAYPTYSGDVSMEDLIRVDIAGWKRFMDGMGRGNIGPFTQRNRVEGLHSIREYFDDEQVVGRLTVLAANTDLCDRICEITQKCVDATNYIYVPTDEEWEAWDEDSILADYDITGERIAALEAERTRNL